MAKGSAGDNIINMDKLRGGDPMAKGSGAPPAFFQITGRENGVKNLNISCTHTLREAQQKARCLIIFIPDHRQRQKGRESYR